MAIAHAIDTGVSSLVPRPFEEEEKGPGTHCAHALFSQ